MDREKAQGKESDERELFLMIKYLMLKGKTKEGFPICVVITQNDQYYTFSVEITTDWTEYSVYSDKDHGFFSDMDVVNDPGYRDNPVFWRGLLEEPMKVVCTYYLLDSYRLFNKPEDNLSQDRDIEVKWNLKQFPVKKFRPSKWKIFR